MISLNIGFTLISTLVIFEYLTNTNQQILETKIVGKISYVSVTLIKKLTDINRCLTNPANRCLTDINRYYISYSTYPILVILNQ